MGGDLLMNIEAPYEFVFSLLKFSVLTQFLMRIRTLLGLVMQT